ncbi:MAG: 23S rRNA (guanosine(2251)-2'-O)-methyltransferase RlmB [Thermoanaerobacteraceae bacterium]|nr:23S rRNA (guanosine(2251)-2'-O)-methyltransferase RlmB [Thermoanaerobacteraceae bacterium]
MVAQIEGRIPVLEALKSGRKVHKVYLAKGSQGQTVQDILDLCRKYAVPVIYVDKHELRERAVTRGHQGVIALGEEKGYTPLEEAVPSDVSGNPIILMLDHLQDPQNFGAILRTAETAGVSAIIIPKRRSVGLSPAVTKVAAGAVEYIPVSLVANLAQTIDWLKDKGYWIVGAEADAASPVYEVDLCMPLVLVIGSEGRGLSRLTREKCDLLVNLPLRGRLNSLNASAAAAALLFEAVRQRLQK